MPQAVVITHGLRSVYAKFGTALRDVSAVELGRQIVDQLVQRADIDPERTDEVVVGCAGAPADAASIGRHPAPCGRRRGGRAARASAVDRLLWRRRRPSGVDYQRACALPGASSTNGPAR